MINSLDGLMLAKIFPTTGGELSLNALQISALRLIGSFKIER